MSNPFPRCHATRLLYLLAAAKQGRAGGQDLRGSSTVAGDGHVRRFPRGARGARPCAPHYDTEITSFVSTTGAVSKISYLCRLPRTKHANEAEALGSVGRPEFCFSPCRTSGPRTISCRRSGIFPRPAVGAQKENAPE